jgi:peptidoglycan hydrolase CwlO-like protein
MSQNPQTVTMIVMGILSAVGGGVLTALVTGIMARGKTKAEAVSIATATTLSIIRDLREEIKRLQERLEDSEQDAQETKARADSAEARASRAEYDVVVLNRGMRSCNSRIAYLTRLLEENGIAVSAWTPPEGIERLKQ